MKKILFFTLICFNLTLIYPHKGKTDKDGCHIDKKTGKSHCHNKKTSSKKS